MRRTTKFWVVPLILAVGTLGSAVLDVFDPSFGGAGGGTNPYNMIELYAEVPQFATLGAILEVLLGLLGILMLVSVEFLFGTGDRLHSAESPIRLFAFVLATIGFALSALDNLRYLELMPDLAHYYYVRDGSNRDAAAIGQIGMVLDIHGLFFHLGTALWSAVLAVDLLRARLASMFWGIVMLAYSASTLLVLFFRGTDAGYPAWMLATILPAVLWPLWYVGIAVTMRRRSHESIPVS
mgnify:CR=1 FL=1